ncbi:P1 family peptidase [Smaragdicoccus niigatensis]|uniref:P1 family peptidase n=1 Tax=Smaragdicoccus niigatensis TaxID=359359 RepID=UPI00037A1D79|nr:P1 family peptidase [Smaragdicoccus niigatensis]
MRTGDRNSLTDVAGLLVGHYTELDSDASMGAGAATGCTVVRAPGGATAAVDVRGGGPGTRETDLLDPSNTVQQVNAIVLAGGSAYGLAAADGVMHWLEEHGEGIAMAPPGPDGAFVVPIVPGAVIFDLPVGAWRTRPTAEFGYRAAESAAVDFACGTVGAGTGARAGSLKGGIGTASVVIEDGPARGIVVAALMVANPVGSVYDPRTGVPWGAMADGIEFFGLGTPDGADVAAARLRSPKGTLLNTTIGVVATDAKLSAGGCRRMAMAGHDGLGRAIRPAHSPLDGDTIFALSTGLTESATGDEQGDLPVALGPAFLAELPRVDAVCAAAAVCVERAIVNAVLAATAVAGIPSYRDSFPSAFGSRA